MSIRAIFVATHILRAAGVRSCLPCVHSTYFKRLCRLQQICHFIINLGILAIFANVPITRMIRPKQTAIVLILHIHATQVFRLVLLRDLGGITIHHLVQQNLICFRGNSIREFERNRFLLVVDGEIPKQKLLQLFKELRQRPMWQGKCKVISAPCRRQGVAYKEINKDRVFQRHEIPLITHLLAYPVKDIQQVRLKRQSLCSRLHIGFMRPNKFILFCTPHHFILNVPRSIIHPGQRDPEIIRVWAHIVHAMPCNRHAACRIVQIQLIQINIIECLIKVLLTASLQELRFDFHI